MDEKSSEHVSQKTYKGYFLNREKEFQPTKRQYMFTAAYFVVDRSGCVFASAFCF